MYVLDRLMKRTVRNGQLSAHVGTLLTWVAVALLGVGLRMSLGAQWDWLVGFSAVLGGALATLALRAGRPSYAEQLDAALDANGEVAALVDQRPRTEVATLGVRAWSRRIESDDERYEHALRVTWPRVPIALCLIGAIALAGAVLVREDRGARERWMGASPRATAARQANRSRADQEPGEPGRRDAIEREAERLRDEVAAGTMTRDHFADRMKQLASRALRARSTALARQAPDGASHPADAVARAGGAPTGAGISSGSGGDSSPASAASDFAIDRAVRLPHSIALSVERYFGGDR